MIIDRITGFQQNGPATMPLPEMLMAGRPSSGPGRATDGNSGAMKTGTQNGNGSPLPRNLSAHVRHDSLSRPQNQPPRVALYSHDTMGLGHLRRNLLIAQSLSQAPLQATSLLITGAHEANFFSLPEGADFLTLPRLRKDQEGRYTAGQLAISIEDLICLRAESISSALLNFQPDVLVVDKVPTGAFGELLPALRALARQAGTQCVLGIRDILDDPETVRTEWAAAASPQVIDEFFDEIWVYGDQQVYDPVLEYHWREPVASKVRFTGYLNQASRLSSPQPQDALPLDRLGNPGDRLVVCTLGGGQDGYALGKAFVEALPTNDHFGVLLAGPFMPPALLNSLQATAAARDNLLVLKFTPESDLLIERADRVIAMGGYNTVCSILSFQKRALVVPRVFPRREQSIRAERLQQLGLLDVLHPEQLSPEALRQWMTSDPEKRPTASHFLDLAGLTQVQQLCGALLGKAPKRRSTPPTTAPMKHLMTPSTKHSTSPPTSPSGGRV